MGETIANFVNLSSLVRQKKTVNLSGVEIRHNEIIEQGPYFINFNNTKKNAALICIYEDL